MHDFIANSEIFKKLSVEEKEIFSDACELKKLKKDEELFKEKDLGDTVYIVVDGMIKIEKMISGADMTTLALNKKGDIFGEMAIFDIIPRYANAVAIAPAVVLSLSKKKFLDIRAQNPSAALAIMDIIVESLARRLRRITDRMYGIY